MSSADPEETIGTKLVKGSAWLIALRWAVRLVGLVNTFILVRLLNPSDFGVVAMAMIVVGMIETIAESGQKLVVIKHPNPQRADYDTAWTMSILFGLTVSVVILLLSPLTEYYFREPRTIDVMKWLALRSFIGGFENIGVLDFRRDLRFDRHFIYLVSTKLISIAITIVAAFIYRDYWALVIGIVSAQAIMVGMSFILSSYRPRFSLVKFHEMWNFSAWASIRSIGIYLNEQVDQVAVGGFSGASAMGRYRVASDISSLFTAEILGPIVAALFPVMASVQSDAVKMRNAYLGVFQWTAIICISISVGVALCGDDIVDVLLGAKWVTVKPLIPWLALSAGLLAMGGSVYSAFEVTGRPKLSAQLQWTRLVSLSIGVFLIGFATRNITYVAVTRFVVTIALTPALFMVLARTIDIPGKTILLSIWRPLVAAGAMSATVWGLNQYIETGGMLRLVMDIASGGLIFFLASIILWSLSGRPDAPEKFVWNVVLSKLHGA
jgi:O-antigen/teichoic acid export membrane protein